MIRRLVRIASCLTTLIFLTATTAAAETDVTAPIVDLGYARYQGYFDEPTNATSFLGIRYAAPPIGNLRFQAPQPPINESNVQPATRNPNMCYQAWFGYNLTASVSPYGHNKRQTTLPPASEDCLFLNVYIPGAISAARSDPDGFPTLVWIHGGGYENGSATEYNGADLLADSLDSMVVVVIQYRLGVFGFLSGNDVQAHGALNAGLLDQAFALQWVQRYIGFFGGNKAHVTIWGESSGATSVVQHIVAHGGNTQPPLFHAAITSSIAMLPQYYYNDRVPQTLYNQTVLLTGCGSRSDTFACLQSVDANILQNANTHITQSVFYGTFAFVPVVDGTFIIERPTVTLAGGRVNGNILLSFGNQNEGNMFEDPDETLTITDYVSQLFPDMSYSLVQEVALIYQSYGTALEQATQVMGDAIFTCPTYYLLRTFTGRSWKGLFAIPPAYHAQDLPYYFYSPSFPPLFNNPQFITAFVQPFMSLAKYYDVNVKFDPSNITPKWEMYDVGETEMLFNRTEAGAPVVMPIRTDQELLQRCAFWSTVTDMTAQ